MRFKCPHCEEFAESLDLTREEKGYGVYYGEYDHEIVELEILDYSLYCRNCGRKIAGSYQEADEYFEEEIATESEHNQLKGGNG